MSYSVKEIFLTLQGEGGQTGRVAVFLRFAGCNLWSGREQDRGAAVCRFCDTDFVGVDGVGGGRFESAAALAEAAAAEWGARAGRRLVVCTGGEPLLQLDGALIDALRAQGFEIAVETNGTLKAPAGETGGLDWICVSPKGAAALALTEGDELKLVYPQIEPEADPDRFVDLPFRSRLLQPMEVAGDPKRSAANVTACVERCLADPRWRLSLQTHKVLGLR